MAGFNNVKVSRRLVLKRQAANFQYPLPAGAAVRRVQFYNRTDGSVTGGIRVGNVAGGGQIVAATPVGANALVEATIASAGISTTPVTLHIEAATAWNDQEVDIAIEYDELLDSKHVHPNTDNLAYVKHDPV